jgi:ribosome-associated toxin RatA of RatAB toxin-antitoxin module
VAQDTVNGVPLASQPQLPEPVLVKLLDSRRAAETVSESVSAGAMSDSLICGLDTIQQDMERLPQGVRRLAVQLRMDLDPACIWAVLTDYTNLHCFIPNLETSRLLWRRANVVGLEQEGCQNFMGLRFKAQVQLELTERPEQGRLDFVMVKGDFRRFEGAWQIGHDSAGTTLLYELTVQGFTGMPIGLIEQRLRDDLATNLRAVQREAISRAA